MKKTWERVAVLMGGWSAEREVSLRSGAAVLEGLKDAGYGAEGVDLRSPKFELPEGTQAVFIALHGEFGEDGGLQAILQTRGIPYTGMGPEASRVAFDKSLTRDRLSAAGVPVPPGVTLDRPSEKPPLPLPLVVKPSRQGSSVGCGFVFQPDEWAEALTEAFRYDRKVVVETFIEGSELTVGFVGDEVLPVIEIRAPGGRYDLAAKYTVGMTEYLVPAPMEESVRIEVQELAARSYRALDGRGMGRVDLRRTPGGDLYVLELNTIPGFTRTSLLPKAAAAAGLSFSELCDRILRLARI
ncbi:MAG: D-alanine--D-alanine ligase [Kiritimatiellia bacterium]|nr:D-alanine--D-alanine ligase [Kiritimatiellia bacterium]